MGWSIHLIADVVDSREGEEGEEEEEGMNEEGRG